MTAAFDFFVIGRARDAAERIASVLRTRGHSVFDPDASVVAGEARFAVVEAALSVSAMTVVLLTKAAPSALDREVIAAAVERARRQAHRVVPVHVDADLGVDDVPFGLRRLRAIERAPPSSIADALERALNACRRTEQVRAQTGAEVRALDLGALAAIDPERALIHVRNELFAAIVALEVPARLPIVVIVDDLVRRLGLPDRLDYLGRAGVAFQYRLAHADRVLDRGRTLAAEGVPDGALVALQVELRPFALADPLQGALGSAVFRGEMRAVPADLDAQAHEALRVAINEAGLGP